MLVQPPSQNASRGVIRTINIVQPSGRLQVMMDSTAQATHLAATLDPEPASTTSNSNIRAMGFRFLTVAPVYLPGHSRFGKASLKGQRMWAAYQPSHNSRGSLSSGTARLSEFALPRLAVLRSFHKNWRSSVAVSNPSLAARSEARTIPRERSSSWCRKRAQRTSIRGGGRSAIWHHQDRVRRATPNHCDTAAIERPRWPLRSANSVRHCGLVAKPAPLRATQLAAAEPATAP